VTSTAYAINDCVSRCTVFTVETIGLIPEAIAQPSWYT
jgi:hypothetical protein